MSSEREGRTEEFDPGFQQTARDFAKTDFSRGSRIRDTLKQRLLEKAIESANGARTTIRLRQEPPSFKPRLLVPVFAAALIVLAAYPLMRRSPRPPAPAKQDFYALSPDWRSAENFPEGERLLAEQSAETFEDERIPYTWKLPEEEARG